MRFNTTINNVKAKEWGLNIQQAYLFAWFYELPSWASTLIFDNKIYYFASKNKAIEELCLLSDKIDTIYRLYKQIENKGLIDIKKFDSKDYILLTEKAKEWNYKKDSDLNPTLGNKSENNSDLNPTYNNINSNNTFSQSENLQSEIDKQIIQTFNSLKDPNQNNNNYSHTDFLKDYNTARQKYSNILTNLETLTTFEKNLFNKINQTKEYYRKAIDGLFYQKNLPLACLTRPKHLLDKIESYHDAGVNKLKLYNFKPEI